MAGKSRSKQLAEKLLHKTLWLLKENDGELPVRDIHRLLEQSLELDEWAKGIYPKTGNVRWTSILHFYSIDAVKAGYLRKRDGVWYLTKEGEQALSLSPEDLLKSAQKAYREWKIQNQKDNKKDDTIDEQNEEQLQAANLEEFEQAALEGIRSHLFSLFPYEFQDIVAALLRGMGYYTTFIASPGKDGGVDIIAYQDPLGTKTPRIKVQVKHRQNTSASVQEVRQLMGLLSPNEDIGLFVSSGGFTSDAKALVRNSHVHVELVTLDRFVQLWKSFYHKMSEEDKSLLPLRAIYFLAPTD